MSNSKNCQYHSKQAPWCSTAPPREFWPDTWVSLEALHAVAGQGSVLISFHYAPCLLAGKAWAWTSSNWGWNVHIVCMKSVPKGLMFIRELVGRIQLQCAGQGGQGFLAMQQGYFWFSKWKWVATYREYIIYYIECPIGVLNLYLSRERGLTHKSCQIGSGELEVAVHGNLLWGRCLLHACMISTGLLLTIGMWACSHSEDSMTISWSTWEVNTSPPFHLPGTRRHPPTRKDTPERMWFIRRWYPW